MKLKIVTKNQIGSLIKCTIHKNGRLGFSTSAVEKLSLSEKTFVRLAINEEDKSDSSLYMLISKVKSDDSVKIIKAGNYYFCRMKPVFDELGIDYTKNKIIFDISEMDYEGEKVYKLKRRELERKKNK